MRVLTRLTPAAALLLVASWGRAEEPNAAGAARRSARTFIPTARLDVNTLSKLLLERSPGLQDERLRLDLAGTDTRQSRLYDNPQLDGSWATIPIGETNPAGLQKPLANVPNYSVGVSYRFLLGKRGPRIERAQALERSARQTLVAATRREAFQLAGVIGAVAAASLRIERLRTLLDEGKGSLDVARARMSAGSGTPLEVDRLEIELSRVAQQVLASEGDLAAALSLCSGFVGMPCVAFPSTEEGKKFLLGFADGVRDANVDVERRPDVQALEADRAAAASERELARAQALPDPTVRLGYTNDRFVAAGNQENSLNVSVALPLALLDRGQAQVAAAEAKENRARLQRELLTDAARARIDALRLVLQAIARRQRVLETEMLPRARAVVNDLERAVGSRLIPVTDLIQARRTLAELLLEEIDAFGDAFRASVELMGELGLTELGGGR